MLAKPGETMTGRGGFYSLEGEEATPARPRGIAVAFTVALQRQALVWSTRRRARASDRQTGYFSRIIRTDPEASSRSTPMSTSARRLRYRQEAPVLCLPSRPSRSACASKPGIM